MPRLPPALTLATLSLAAASILAVRVQSEEFQCRRGDQARRIEVRFADDGDRLPCQVLYWRDLASREGPRVPWSADHQLDFCINKARELTDQLQSSGWSCAGEPTLAEESPDQGAGAPSEPSAGAPAAAGEPTLAENAIKPDAGAPSQPSARAPAAAGEPTLAENAVKPDAGAPSQPSARAPAAAGEPTLAEDAIEPGAGAPSKPSARAPAAPPAPAPPRDEDGADGSSEPDQAALRAALTRDLRRLNELGGASSGGFNPENAVVGDLDGDGVADGAVLLTHRDEDGGASYHLLAYLFDGKTFRPVARVNLEAYYRNFANVAIEAIAGGGIDLLLRTPRAGDPACCPSGRRRATFELRDGQLVLAAESDEGA